MNTLINVLKRNGSYLISIMLIIAFVQSTARAQMSTLNKGDRVRIGAPGIHTKSIVGIVYDISSTGMLVSSKDTSFTVPFATVKQLDISTGKRRRAGKGAFLGFTVGVLTGGVIGVATFKECNEEGLFACFMVPETPGDAFLLGAIAGGVSGLVLGTITGLFVKTDRWARMPITFSAGLTPVPTKSFSLSPSVSLRFTLSKRSKKKK